MSKRKISASERRVIKISGGLENFRKALRGLARRRSRGRRVRG